MKGARVLVADQSETALLLESPSTFADVTGRRPKVRGGALYQCERSGRETYQNGGAAFAESTRDAPPRTIELVIEPGLRSRSFPSRRGDAGRVSYRDASHSSASAGRMAIEGTLKAPGRQVVEEPPSAAEKARLADDTSRQIGTRDAFYGDLVPFLRGFAREP